MIEDDDKVRRNLVVVSFAILLYFWFDLPSGVLVGRILGADAKVQISEWKVWTLLCLILVYQIHRFYSISASSERWVNATEAYVQARFKIIKRLLQVELHSLSKDSEFKHRLIDFPAKDALLKIAQEADVHVKEHLNISECSYEAGVFWEGNFTVDGSKRDKYGGIQKFDFSVPGPKRWVIDLKTSARLSASEHASEFAFPVLLAYCALLGALNSLMHSLL